jgi:hypothetical protein
MAVNWWYFFLEPVIGEMNSSSIWTPLPGRGFS